MGNGLKAVEQSTNEDGVFLDQLEEGSHGPVVVMICRRWDVNTIIGKYMSTDFIVSDKKGGPRISLYELCQEKQWPMPIFTTSEQKSKTPIEVGEGADKRTTFNSYKSQIRLTIPNDCVVQLTGDLRADKKSSFDSAALRMLFELQRCGKLKIG